MQTVKKAAKRPMMFLLAGAGLILLFVAKWVGIYDPTLSSDTKEQLLTGLGIETVYADHTGGPIGGPGGDPPGDSCSGSCSGCST